MTALSYLTNQPAPSEPPAFDPMQMLQKVSLGTAAAPPTGHIAHVLNTADNMGGPVAPPAPDLSKIMPTQAPQVQVDQNPQAEMEGHLANQLRTDWQKDADVPHGFWGKLKHGLDLATGGMNPDSQVMRHQQENQLVNQLNMQMGDEATNAEKGANTAHLTQETTDMPAKDKSLEDYQGAETGHVNAETEALQHPAAEYEVHDTAEGPMVVNKRTGTGQRLSDNGIPIGPKVQTKTVQLQIGGKAHQVLVNDSDGTVIKDLGESGEKPPTVNVNSGEKGWEYANNQLNTLGKPVSDLNMRMGRLKDTLAQGTPQADALVAPELLTIMAGGQGSGLRMNEAEISRIVGGRSHWENLKASAQKWSLDPSTANSITADQRAQVRALVQTVDHKLQAKQSIVNDAANRLVSLENPTEQHQVLAQTRQKLQQVDKFGHYEGEQVTVKGKTVTINKIHPDGSFE